MKKFILSMLAVAALVSCSNEEALEVNKGEAIAFGDAFVDNATRAATDPSLGTTAKPLTAFNVWGTVKGTGDLVAIFANDNVTGEVGANSTWTCTSKTQYWITGAKYNFAALVNAGTVTLGTDLLPATVAFTSDGSTDLLYAKSIEYTGQASGNSKVAFTFEHLLSKVYLKVTNNSAAANNYSFLVKNIKVNAPKTGTYTIASEKWAATAGDYTFANIAVAGGAASAECAAEQLIIPGAATISFDVDILVNDTLNSTPKLVSTTPYTYSTTLAAANAYSFNIQVSVGEPIQFTVEKDPTWTEEDEVTIN